MKKITMLMLFFSTAFGYSQIKNYTFTQSNGSYSPITGGTTLGDAISDAQNFVEPTAVSGTTLTYGTGIPIGFNFTFNGQVYDRFGISNDGWISLGNSTFTTPVDMKLTSATLPLSSVAATATELNTARIAALSANLQGQTGSGIRFLTTGNEGSKELVIQWENYKRSGANGVGDSFNFQIRLKETSNTIQFVYGSFITNDLLNAFVQVGLRAEPSAVASNFVNRTATTGWGNTTAGAIATDNVVIYNAIKPASGLTYLWTPPTCGAAKSLLTSSSTINSATFTWSSYIPASEGYEYVVSTSATLPTGSGTSVTTAAGSVSGLNSATAYNVFVRSYCGSQFTPWVLVGSFKTKCTETTEFFEDFDSYTIPVPTNYTFMADCWERTGTYGGAGTSRVVNVSTGNNKLLLMSASGAENPSMAYAVMPSVSNLQVGNHRLRFRAYCSEVSQKIEIGYYNSTGAFVVGESKVLPSLVANEQEFIITPSTWSPAIPSSVKNLVFRNSNEILVSINIDNVVWEPIPSACAADVKSPNATQITDITAVLNWVLGSSETAWQYVLTTNPAINPYSLTGVNVTGTTPTVSLSSLSPATKYKAWIRSKCTDGSLGAWVGPVVFTTACAPATELSENFDNQTTSNPFPACWRQVGAVTVGIGTSSAVPIPSGPNFFSLGGGYPTVPYSSMVALPPVSNAGANTHRLKFKASKSSTVGVQLIVGWITDLNNTDSFHELTTISDIPSDSYKSYELTFGAVPQSRYLAFKNPGAVSGTANILVKIDDVVWEKIPTTCLDVATVAVEMVKSTSAKLSWTAKGTENAWQYVITSGTESNPYNLSAKNVSTTAVVGKLVNATLTDLTPNTSYKIWLRANCATTDVGNWNGPFVLTTPCSPITYWTQDFDGGQFIPSCWSKAGAAGYASVGGVTGVPSAPFGLNMQSTAAALAVVAMPGVSNLADGTHKLTFKYKSATVGFKFEVGYLKNMADPTSFVSMLEAPYSCTQVFQTASLDFGTDGAPEGTEVLAFRSLVDPAGSVYFDDVTWLPANGVMPPVNDEPTGAITLTVGKDFGANSVVETNAGATNSVQPTPSCGGFNGKDVWSRAIAPASGNITFEINTMPGGITNTAAAVYSGSSSSLTLISCNDSGSTAGDDHPKISLTGRTPGELLYFRVWENGGDAFGSFLASAYDIVLPPVNDEPATAIALTVGSDFGSHSIIETNAGATTSVQPSPGCGGYIGFDVWNSAIVPASGKITFEINSTTGGLTNTAAAVYSGSLSSLTMISCNDSGSTAGGDHPKISLSGRTPGEVLYFRVWEYGGDADGSFYASAYDAVVPLNDEPTGAIALTVGANFAAHSIIETNAGATTSVQPSPGCGGFNGKDVWNSAVVPASGNITFEINSTMGGLTNTAAAVYSGSLSSLTMISCNDSGSGSATGDDHPKISLTGRTPGEVLYFRVWEFGGDAFGSFLASAFDTVAPPVNDEPTGAIVLTVGKDFGANSIVETNVGATTSVQAAPYCGGFNGKDVWSSAVVPASGNITFEINSTVGGLTNTAAAVYTGSLGSLTMFTCNDSGSAAGDDHPKMSLQGRTPGEVLYFRVWEYGGDAFGSFLVSAYDTVAPVLDVDTFETNSFVYYPNPVRDILNLSLNQEITNVAVLNLLGQQVINQSANGNQLKIDMSGLSRGAYLVKVISGNQSKTIKVIKE